MKPIVIFILTSLLGLVSTNASAQPCPANNYFLNSQEEVDLFPSGCSSISGRLVINENTGTAIDDLTPLQDLRSVGNRLAVLNTTILTSLAGLEGITDFGSYVDIRNNDSLQTLNLTSLETIASYLRIQNNAALQNLDSLASLNSTNGYLRIEDNPQLTSITGLSALTSISGYVRVRDNALLASLSGLASVGTIGGNLIIYNNDSLTDINELAALQSINQSLIIQNNANLENIDGLAMLDKVPRDFNISNNAKLESIAGLTSLSEIGRNLRLLNNPLLQSLQGLESVNTLGGWLQIRNNNSLNDISGLAGITNVPGYLQIRNNDMLTSLSGLGNITSIDGYLMVRDNNVLNDVTALAGITTVPGYLMIRNNDMLLSLSGLENIMSIDSYLEIRDNNILENLDALSGITSVPEDPIISGNLTIQNNDGLLNVDGLASLISVSANVVVRLNDQLNACSALIPLLDQIDDGVMGPGMSPVPDVGGTLNIERNGGDECNSLQNILDSIVAPTLSQSFTPDLISVSATIVGSTLQFDIDNTGSLVRALGLAFSNTLPTGVAVASAPNTSTTCTGGNVTTTSNSVSLSGGRVSGASTCSVRVDIVGTADGSYNNVSGSLAFTLPDLSQGDGGTSQATIVVDNTPPVVTVPPPNPVTLFVGDTFTDPAVTATDNIDPNPTITPSGTVNTVIVGMYTRTYTAADSVGNMASEDLTVNVVLPPAPALALDPNDIDFGDTVVGETSTAETITVRNDGTADLTVSMINATTAPFTLDASGTCTAVPFTLIPGSDCTVAYTFSPTVTGAANQSINVTSNADSSPDTLSLAGNGIQPGIALDPNDIDFGDTMVGETSTAKTVTVRNDGTADLTVSMIDAATAPFTLGASGTCTAVPFTLTPGSDCTVAYTFSPTVTGAANQSINVTHDADTSPDTLSLAGNGIQPGIALDPNDIDFGDTMVGETSTSETVTVRNDGTADLTVSMIEAATAPFTLDASGTCTAVPFTLTPGSDCTVAYTFSPTVTGAADQSINVTSNSDTSPDTLSLAGNGILLDRSFTGPLPSGNTGTLSFDTDDISCEFSEDPMFLSGSAAGEPPPASINLIDGITSFRITDCTPGATVELTMEYGDTLPAGAQYWKEGDPWRRIAASVTATSFTFSITDGGPNDDDGIVNGEIVDPSGAAQVRATPPTPVPANPAWLLALLYLAIIGLAQAGGLSRHARRHR